MTVNEILEAARQKGGERYTCEEALHLTVDGRAVSEDDPEGRFILSAKGGTLSTDLAKALGLLKPEPKAKSAPESEPDEKPEPEPEEKPVMETKPEPEAEAKAVREFQDKAVKPELNKTVKRALHKR